MMLLNLIAIALLGLQTPMPILFDTDMESDCDDAGALAMLHALADLGEVELLGTMVSAHHPFSAPTVDAINTYYGRPDLPIGAPRGPVLPTQQGSRYAQHIAETFPHDLPSNDAAPDAVALYRRLLAERADTSVVIVTVGDATNIRYLLESTADASSPLSGKELVRRKVKRWVVMGGRYPEHLDPRPYGNFKPDAESTVIAVQHWPRPIVFSGLGEEILTGSSLRTTPPENPVRRIYELYLEDLDKERPSWDQVALLYAVRETAPYWQEITQGYNRIFDDGTNQWRLMPDSDQVLLELKVDPAVVEAVIESLMSRPPASVAAPPR